MINRKCRIADRTPFNFNYLSKAVAAYLRIFRGIEVEKHCSNVLMHTQITLEFKP